MTRRFCNKTSANIDIKNDIITKVYGGNAVDKYAVTYEYLGYAKRIEKIAGVKISMIGVGPDREQNILR